MDGSDLPNYNISQGYISLAEPPIYIAKNNKTL